METTTTGCRCRPAIEDKPTGSWAIVVLFKAIKRHYTNTAERLSVPPDFKPPRKRHTVVVLVEDINAGALEALAYGISIAPDHLLAVTVVADGPAAEQFEKKWSEYGITVPLEVVQTQTGEFTAATLSYIDEVQARWENDIVNVLIPEFYVQHWWGHLLHNQSTLILKGRLLFRKSTAVTSIPYRVE